MKREVLRTFFLFCVLCFLLAKPLSHFPHPKPLTPYPNYIKLSGNPSKRTDYEPHTHISITSNADFSTQASTENWPGNGSEGNPYVIEGLIIGPTNRILIYIRDTDLHFRIQNCFLNQGLKGIHLISVKNAHISNITVTSSRYRGIEMWEVENSTLSNSRIMNNSEEGIYLRDSVNNILSNNTVDKNFSEGIALSNSQNNLLSNNTISNNRPASGVLLVDSRKTILLGNIIFNNSRGINIGNYSIDSNYCLVSNNTVTNNTEVGIGLNSSTCRLIGNNFINNFINNSGYGLFLFGRDNLVQFNNFYTTNGSQAYDGGRNNSFENNYWSDWIGPDDDGDGIVDTPYSIEEENYDRYPATAAVFHVPSQLVVFFINPNGGEVLADTVVIEWMIFDLNGHDITYTIAYSADGGTTWIPLMTKLNTSFYSWDTKTVMDGSEYLIRINASSTEGLEGNITSATTFTINNRHHLQPFIVLTPIGGEIYFGLVTIQWTPAVDLFNHAVTYSVAYSADSGISWIFLTLNLTATTYIWDSTLVPNGSQYRIRVNASCESGVWQVATSDAFILENESLSSSSSSTEPPYDLLSMCIDTLIDSLLIIQSLGIVFILSWPLFLLAAVVIISHRLGEEK